MTSNTASNSSVHFIKKQNKYVHLKKATAQSWRQNKLKIIIFCGKAPFRQAFPQPAFAAGRQVTKATQKTPKIFSRFVAVWPGPPVARKLLSGKPRNGSKCRLQYNHTHNYDVCSGTEITDILTWCMHGSRSVRGYNLLWLWYKHYIERTGTEISNFRPTDFYYMTRHCI